MTTHARALLLTMALTACSSTANIGEGLPDGSTAPDASRTGPYDECGNGMDDDQDGTIDEGCPCAAGETQGCFTAGYPSRGVGLCSDGVQECLTPGIEFGFWGACSGDTTPDEQACDGRDADCDGAIDEGCPCTAGETRVCGEVFDEVGPCRPGTQTCSASGSWSSCEGAVGPAAEICTDTIDNDCDGVANEGCDCVPEPEICGDGVDNDCDGRVDEPECRAGVFDAGTGDAGVTDAGGDVFMTNPMGPSTLPCAPESLRWDRVSQPPVGDVVRGSFNRSTGFWTGTEYLLVFDGETESGEHSLYITRYDSDANFLSMAQIPVLLTGSFDNLNAAVWTGSHLVVAYTDGGALHILKVNGDGTIIGTELTLGIGGYLAWNGRRLAIVYTGREGGFYLQTYDRNFESPGPVVELTDPGFRAVASSGPRLAWSGQKWLFAYHDIDDEVVALAVASDTELELTRTVSAAQILTTPSLGGGPDGGLWCWQRAYGAWDYTIECEHFDAFGAAVGEPRVIYPRPSDSMGTRFTIIRWGDAHVVILADSASRSASYIWQDGSSDLVLLPAPDMNTREWGYNYWESDFSNIVGSPDALVMFSRGDQSESGARGYVPARTRLSCD